MQTTASLDRSPRRASAWIAPLAAIVLAAGAGPRADGPRDGGPPAREPSSGPDKPAEKRDGGADRGFPWTADTEYVLSWTHERKRVGETRFRFRDLKAPPKDGAKAGAAPGPAERYVLTSRLEYSRDGNTQKTERELRFDSSLALLKYHTRSRLDAVNGAKAVQDAQGWREGKRLAIEVAQDSRGDRPARVELELPDGAWVLLASAPECLVLVLPRLLESEKPAPVPIAYPDFGKVFEVEFRPRGEEAVRLSGEGEVKCRRFEFSSGDRQLQGEVWIDARGRMLRYRQGSTEIQLESAGAKRP